MSNTRETIFDDYEASLAGIKASAGYLSTVKKVTRSPEFMKFSHSTGNTPAINIIDQRDTFMKFIDATYGLAIIELTLECVIKATANLEEKVNKLIADIKLHTDTLSITNVRKAYYTGIAINYARAEAYFTVDIAMNYSYTRSAP